MDQRKGLGIIFHSGSFDRLYHGLSLSLASAALGRETKLFFSYWALEYLKKDKPANFQLDSQAKEHQEILEKNLKKGHLQKILELMSQAKALGVKCYVCSNSLGLLNISRDELIEQVDKSMGITTFLTETANDQMLFI